MSWSPIKLEPGEGKPVTVLLINGIFTGLTGVFLLTSANVLFLDAYGARYLPHAYIGAGILGSLVGLLYTKIQKYVSLRQLLSGNLAFFVFIIVLFRLLFELPGKWPAAILFISATMITNLSGLVTEAVKGLLFNIRQGKRLFGFISVGALIPAIAGGFAVPLLVKIIRGTENLLIFSALGLAISLAILFYIFKAFPESFSEADGNPDKASEKSASAELPKSRYLLLIFAFSVMMIFSFYFINYNFGEQLNTRFPDKDEMASYFAIFLSIGYVISLLSVTFISSRVLTRYGLTGGLIILPAVLMIGSIALVIGSFLPGALIIVFAAAVINRIIYLSFMTPFTSPSLATLYLPLPVHQRIGAQAMTNSVVMPVFTVIAGALLLLFTDVFHFEAIHISIALIIVLAVWIVITLLLRKEYPVVLDKALSKRALGEISSLSLEDSSTLGVIQNSLKSSVPGRVIYALNVLAELNDKSLNAVLVELLSHPAPEVRLAALEKIEGTETDLSPEVIQPFLQREKVPEVKGRACRTLSAIGGSDVFEEVVPYLSDNHREVRMGAMVGLLRHCGIEGVLAAGEPLIKFQNSENAAERAFAAEVLGEVHTRSFYRPLLKLLNDPELEVKREALTAAGKLKNPALWPSVLSNLSESTMSGAAKSALVAGGDSTLPVMETAFTSHEQKSRLRIVDICARIPGEMSSAFLKSRIDFPDADIRCAVLTALEKKEYHADNREDSEAANQQLLKELASAAWLNAALLDIDDDADYAPLKKAINSDISKILERVFDLLSFIYPAQNILRARDNINSPSSNQRAIALEIVDLLLPRQLKDWLIFLLEHAEPAKCLDALKDGFPQKQMSHRERLKEIIISNHEVISPWTQNCALYAVGKRGDKDLCDTVLNALSSPEWLLRETAVWVLSSIDPQDFKNRVNTFKRDPNPNVVRIASQLSKELTNN